MLFHLVGVLAAAIFVVAAVVAFVALKNGGSVVLLIGSVLGLFNSLGWLVFQVMQRSGSVEWGAPFFTSMRILGTFSWVLTALGVLLLALSLAGLRRQNQALESIIAGSQNDRVA